MFLFFPPPPPSASKPARGLKYLSFDMVPRVKLTGREGDHSTSFGVIWAICRISGAAERDVILSRKSDFGTVIHVSVIELRHDVLTQNAVPGHLRTGELAIASEYVRCSARLFRIHNRAYCQM
jgi:hypothetical protein